jgi:hypothetical protein
VLCAVEAQGGRLPSLNEDDNEVTVDIDEPNFIISNTTALLCFRQFTFKDKDHLAQLPGCCAKIGRRRQKEFLYIIPSLWAVTTVYFLHP